MDCPSKTPPSKASLATPDTPSGQVLYATISPLVALMRTRAYEFHGTSQMDAPSKTPQKKETLFTAAGQEPNAAMAPLEAFTRTTALLYHGTSHTDCPSNAPP
jgi:hypothetical protein